MGGRTAACDFVKKNLLGKDPFDGTIALLARGNSLKAKNAALGGEFTLGLNQEEIEIRTDYPVDPNSSMIQWMYQVCTEVAYF